VNKALGYKCHCRQAFVLYNENGLRIVHVLLCCNRSLIAFGFGIVMKDMLLMTNFSMPYLTFEVPNFISPLADAELSIGML